MGETIHEPGGLEIFGDRWSFAALRCVEPRDLEAFVSSEAQVGTVSIWKWILW